MTESMYSDIMSELRRRDALRAELQRDARWAAQRIVELLDRGTFDALDDHPDLRWVRRAAADVLDAVARLEDIK
jgi:hypothetical protein